MKYIVMICALSMSLASYAAASESGDTWDLKRYVDAMEVALGPDHAWVQEAKKGLAANSQRIYMCANDSCGEGLNHSGSCPQHSASDVDTHTCSRRRCIFKGTASELDRHMKDSHSNSYACTHPGCSFATDYISNLSRHLRNQHPN